VEFLRAHSGGGCCRGAAAGPLFEDSPEEDVVNRSVRHGGDLQEDVYYRLIMHD